MRLADRRGVFTRADLSVPAVFGLELLMMLDSRDKTQAYFRDLRSRMVAAHPDQMERLFPEWFPDAAFTNATRADGTVDPDKVDETKLHWDTPSSTSEHEELERWLAEHMDGTVSAASLDERGWE